MRKNVVYFAAMAAFLLLLLPIQTKAAKPLDEIKNYVITIDMRQDGTMDIKYHLDWTVLDDTAEGPLTWVQIGIPNHHADEIKALSDNISSISKVTGDGTRARVDFKRAYQAGETVSFDFSIHQSYMYKLDKSAQTCFYSFTPGWFDEIEVKSLKILWNKANVASSSATGSEGEYLVWETALGAGKRYKIKVSYPIDVFDVSEDMQAKIQAPSQIVLWLLVVGYLVFRAILLINRYRGGFGRSGAHAHTHHSCACAGCACACACACAGGGRAGCSVKDFYGAGVPVQALKKRLK